MNQIFWNWKIKFMIQQNTVFSIKICFILQVEVLGSNKDKKVKKMYSSLIYIENNRVR